MNNSITAGEHQLSKIFCADYDFVIPPYQRPYAWTTEHAEALFEDLHEFHQSNQAKSGDAISPYFLGSIVLIKKAGSSCAKVVDGQQRLTTLTSLFAAIAAKLPSEISKNVEEYVRDPGNTVERRQPKPRLLLREEDREMFSLVQSMEFEKLLRESPKNESQSRIQENARFFLAKLDEEFSLPSNSGEIDVKKLTSFVTSMAMECYLVAVETPTQSSACRIYQVLNDRGLGLLTTDIIKAKIIGGDKEHGDSLAKKWEEMENMVGREQFEGLFEHIRMIYVKKKAQASLLDEFKKNVLNHLSGDFIAMLGHYADAYRDAKQLCYESVDGEKADVDAVNRSLYWLNQIDNSDWLPPAILFLSQRVHNAEYTRRFFQKLERLAAYMHMCAKNVNQRIVRYAEVISALEGEHSMSSPIQAIELGEDEKAEAKKALDGNIYEMQSRRRNYVILRLNSFVGEGQRRDEGATLTIEHVLPQTVDSGSEWAELWQDEEQREKWMHRIANLVLLSRKRNSKALNYPFGEKKSAYFSGGSPTTYALTVQVIHEDKWTPEIVEKRQNYLLGVFTEEWELE